MRSKYHGLFNLLAIASVFFVASHHVRHLVKEGKSCYVLCLKSIHCDRLFLQFLCFAVSELVGWILLSFCLLRLVLKFESLLTEFRDHLGISLFHSDV